MDDFVSDASDVTHVSDSSSEAPAVQKKLYDFWTPPTDVEYEGIKHELLNHLQTLVMPHGYAISTSRTKNYGSGRRAGQLCKIWIQCDRGSKAADSIAKVRKRTSSRREGCPFSIIANRTRDPGWKWKLRIEEGRHCHKPHAAVAHPKQRKLHMTPEIKEKILHDSRTGSKPSEILASLRLSSEPFSSLLAA